MMKIRNLAVKKPSHQLSLIAIAGLALVGCGPKQEAVALPDTNTVAIAVVDTGQPVVQPTNNPPKAGALSTASPTVKKQVSSALAAYASGDYGRAQKELQDLLEDASLTPEQRSSVQELLAAVKAKAEGKDGQPEDPANPRFALVEEGRSPFLTANPAAAERYAAAKLAVQIGDWDRARMELSELATNTQLNWQQKLAIESLLAQVPPDAPTGL